MSTPVISVCRVIIAVVLGATAATPVAAQRGIAVDARMAEDLGLTVGARVRLSARPGELGDSATVAAIYERKADPAEVF